MEYTLALDLGTTSTRAVVFAADNTIISSHSEPLQLSSPQPGWEEQDPMELVEKTVVCAKHCLEKAKLSAADIAAIGITNQRETVVAWDPETGKPLYPAIVWKDSRAQSWCKEHQGAYKKAQLQQINGCPLSPYFSATKIRWLLDNCSNKKPLIGTLDCYLLWHLTGGKVFATDISNASRTALLDCKNGTWSDDCLSFFNIPSDLLPTIMKSADNFTETSASLFGSPIPIRGMIGDQQAALVGQGCTQAGDLKCTYGTGSFLMMNTESEFLPQDDLIATVAYEAGNVRHYALEGGGFSAGSMLNWLQETCKLFDKPADIDGLLAKTNSNAGTYIIPAFSGLGAPYWTDHIGAEVGGLTLASKSQHILRAAMEAIANQSWDIVQAMQSHSKQPTKTMRIDGGVANSNWLCQYLADLVDTPVSRPASSQWVTALGAAQMARLGANRIKLGDISDSTGSVFHPSAEKATTQHAYQVWEKAVRRYCETEAQ
jgi:glycerol kinase